VSAARVNASDTLAALLTDEAKANPVIPDYVTFLRTTFRNATMQLGGFVLQARNCVRVSIRVPVPVSNQVLVADTRARARTRPSVLE
jgi:hypothetical protein